MKPTEFTDCIPEGLKSMGTVLITMTASYVLNAVNTELGLTPYVLDTVTPLISGPLFPVITFLVLAALLFFVIFQTKTVEVTGNERYTEDEIRQIVEQQEPLSFNTVLLTFRIGHLTLEREFTLADRSHFEYPVLLGRNVINGLAAVDPSRRNVL